MSGDLEQIYGNGGFDASAHEPNEAGDGFEVMPVHWNSFMIEELEVRDMSKVTGKYLWLKLGVIGERFRGRKVFQRITLWRDLESLDSKAAEKAKKAVEIGMRDLAALAQACGVMTVRDTAELADKTFDGRVKVRPAREGFDADNEIGAFAAFGTKVGTEVKGAPAPKAPAPTGSSYRERRTVPTETSAQAAPAGPAPAKRPWER